MSSQPFEPDGHNCEVERLSRRHKRSAFRCGIPDLDRPLVEFRLDGPRKDRALLVAVRAGDDRVIGYVGIQVTDLRLDRSVTGKAFYIPWLGVQEGLHRRGIGTRLIGEALLVAKEWTKVHGPGPVALHAKDHLDGLYSSLGFCRIDGGLMAMSASVLESL
jgi:GNAT superfamily N-acetyltransferase